MGFIWFWLVALMIVAYVSVVRSAHPARRLDLVGIWDVPGAYLLRRGVWHVPGKSDSRGQWIRTLIHM